MFENGLRFSVMLVDLNDELLSAARKTKWADYLLLEAPMAIITSEENIPERFSAYLLTITRTEELDYTLLLAVKRLTIAMYLLWQCIQRRTKYPNIRFSLIVPRVIMYSMYLQQYQIGHVLSMKRI